MDTGLTGNNYTASLTTSFPVSAFNMAVYIKQHVSISLELISDNLIYVLE